MSKLKTAISIVSVLVILFVAYNAFTASSGIEISPDIAGQNGLTGRLFEMEEEGKEYLTFLGATIYYLKEINIPILLLLIPEQMLMYYAAGKIYFAFLKNKRDFKVSGAKLARISLEINFVNHAFPSSGASGLAYLIWRLKEYKVSAGQLSFAHALRYAICAIGNTVQTFIAICIVLVMKSYNPDQTWALWLAAILALGTQLLIFVGWRIVRRQKNVDWLSDKASRGINKVVRKVTRGKKHQILKEESVSKFFTDLRSDYVMLRKNGKALWRPAFWGGIYSFLELAVYWVVGCSFGHPEILPQIMIAEGVASVVGLVMVTPGGIGGYEAAMIAVMAATGVDLSIATAIVVVTRVCIFAGTIISGWGFYQGALMGRKDKFDVKVTEEEMSKEA